MATIEEWLFDPETGGTSLRTRWVSDLTYEEQFAAQWVITPPEQRGGVSPQVEAEIRAAIAGQGAAALAAGWVMPVPEPGTIMGIKIPDTSAPWAEPGAISIGRRVDEPFRALNQIDLASRFREPFIKGSEISRGLEPARGSMENGTFPAPGQDAFLALALLFL